MNYPHRLPYWVWIILTDCQTEYELSPQIAKVLARVLAKPSWHGLGTSYSHRHCHCQGHLFKRKTTTQNLLMAILLDFQKGLMIWHWEVLSWDICTYGTFNAISPNFQSFLWVTAKRPQRGLGRCSLSNNVIIAMLFGDLGTVRLA